MATSPVTAVATIAILRTSTSSTLSATSIYVQGYSTTSDGGEGSFSYISSDTTSSDNGGTIIVDASSRRWYRAFTGALDVRAFGVTANGTTNDSVAMNAAVSASKAANFPLWCPAGTINMGTTTLSFSGVPKGFSFQSHPDSEFLYSGTDVAIDIDSTFLASFEFGNVQGIGGQAVGLQLKPTLVGPNGQTVNVLTAIKFNQIAGFQIALYFNCSAGSIAQCRVQGMSIQNGGNLPANSLSGSVEAIQVAGTSPNIFQGNEVDINYIQTGYGAFSSGVIWTGIASGGSTWGPTLNNANTYKFGAIDGEGYNNSLGLNEWGMFNVYIGQLDDLQTGVQLENPSKYTSLVLGIIDVNASGTYIENLSADGFSAYTLFSPIGFRYSQSGLQATNQFGNQSIVQAGQVTLTSSPQTFSFNSPSFAQTPVIVGSLANGGAQSVPIDIVAISGKQFTVHGTAGNIVNWIAQGFVSSVQPW